MAMTRRELGAAAMGAAAAAGTVGIGMTGAASAASSASSGDGLLPVPAQQIPVPKTVSPEAQAFIRAAQERVAATQGGKSTPPEQAAGMGSPDMLRQAASRFKGKSETIPLGPDAVLYRVVPAARTGRRTQVAFVDIHGGGFISGGGEINLLRAQIRAAQWGVEIYSIDYRLLPQHTYPAPLDDCMAAWRKILANHKPADLVLCGSSAGGNLAAATLLRGRDEGLPMPAGLVLHTPVMDMLGEGDSRKTNKYLDLVLRDMGDARAYGEGQDQSHPYISPVHGDFAKGWPPTLLTTGTRDLLLSDTVRTHRALRRANVQADLLVTEAGSHGGFMGRAPEDMEILAETLKFSMARWGLEG
ncbi:MAG TPA: alpha/beta hydrolase [Sphingobium sp.]|uniref:alpha/beta hydrolase n=1 Tax=Sphingobium sp. TaxID=1912891 RepID=UPI002ED356B3